MAILSVFHEPHRLAARYAAQSAERTQKLTNAIKQLKSTTIGKKDTVQNSILFTVNKSADMDTFEIETLIGNKVVKNGYSASVPTNSPEKIGEKIYDFIIRLSDKQNGLKKLAGKMFPEYAQKFEPPVLVKRPPVQTNEQLFATPEQARFFDIVDTMIK